MRRALVVRAVRLGVQGPRGANRFPISQQRRPWPGNEAVHRCEIAVARHDAQAPAEKTPSTAPLQPTDLTCRRGEHSVAARVGVLQKAGGSAVVGWRFWLQGFAAVSLPSRCREVAHAESGRRQSHRLDEDPESALSGGSPRIAGEDFRRKGVPRWSRGPVEAGPGARLPWPGRPRPFGRARR